MDREVAATLHVQFINGNKLSKTYPFWIDEYMLSRLNSEKFFDHDSNSYPICNITNEFGYKYHNSEIIISYITYGADMQNYDPKNPILFLIDIKKTGEFYNREISNHTNFNDPPKEKEKRKEKKTVRDYVSNKLVVGRVQEVEMSIYGPAFGAYDGFISYDKENDEWVDVSQILFNHSKVYAIPVPKDQIKVNDFIYHNGHWIRVLEVKNGNVIKAEIPVTKIIVDIIPVKNIFGLDFYSKLVYFDCGTIDINNDNNMLMCMMMEDKDMKMKDIMMLMMMNQNGNNSMNLNNPMMMYMMMKDENEDIDPMMMMLMMNQNQK